MVRFKILISLYAFPFLLEAAEFDLSKNNNSIAEKTMIHEVVKGESVLSLAEDYEIGLFEFQKMNPTIDLNSNLLGKKINLPHRIKVPKREDSGIVVVLSDLKLYYYPEDTDEKVYVFPVGVGRNGWETPEMETYVREKIKNPTWTPTRRIRENYKEKYGKELPDVMPAGPDNPLGNYAMRLNYSVGQYLIHGTNKTIGDGMRISSGCVRMNPQDIEWLFNNVPKGINVKIIK